MIGDEPINQAVPTAMSVPTNIPPIPRYETPMTPIYVSFDEWFKFSGMRHASLEGEWRAQLRAAFIAGWLAYYMTDAT